MTKLMAQDNGSKNLSTEGERRPHTKDVPTVSIIS